MNRTIPEIAEELRHHINTDNDAERLICDHILPLLQINTLVSFLELSETSDHE